MSNVPVNFKNSRIGKQAIAVPKGVTVKINDGVLNVKGPKGELSQKLLPEVLVSINENSINVEQNTDPSVYSRRSRSIHGLTRALLNNMVIGVSKGFAKELEVIGVGYKADVRGKKLVLNLGYSHPIDYPFPDGIKIEAKAGPQSTLVTVSGNNKEKVNQTAAEIRSFRSPDSYKGKGVRYKGEVVRLKDGKK
ncbi:MAG: 50S ribosomal protein L6 [Deltaproteobacteria bacterium]|nr:50S ribosomal protein L6 [Deltaproteobacteria bacterium]